MKLVLCVCLSLGLFPSVGWAELPELIGIIKSDTTKTQFGRGITAIGDQNGDGRDDILVWDYRFSQYLYYGRESFDTINTCDFRIDSISLYLSNLDDVNHDGFDDFAAEARGSDSRHLNLYYGGPSLSADRDLWFGVDTLWGFGYPVRCLDLNANGTEEIVCQSNRQTSVVLFELGSNPDSIPDLELTPANMVEGYDYNSCGRGLISGDFNGDGRSDLGVGFRQKSANLDRGSVYLYWGGETFDTIPEMIVGRPGGYVPGSDQFSDVLVYLGDISGDGYDDFFASSGVADDDRLGFVYFGGPDVDTIPDVTIDYSASHASATEDLNGDTYNDLILSYPLPFAGIGYVLVFYGGPDMDSIPDLQIHNADIVGWQEELGLDCAGIGDFNGDGINDFAFSAIDAYNYGLVFIFSGTDNGTDVKYDYEPTLPDGYILSQNYPNPFNMSTTIEFALPERSDITLKVYNILGGEVRNLIDKNLAAGTYTVQWNGQDELGVDVSSGVYLYRLSAGEVRTVKKMVLVK